MEVDPKQRYRGVPEKEATRWKLQSGFGPGSFYVL
jgi:hypothetical protein